MKPSIYLESELTDFLFITVPSSMVSSAGVVKIVVRQSAGKEGGPVPTLAVAPSPRVTSSLSLHAHANTLVTPVRNTGPLQIAQRTPGPATAHYTIAPPRNPISTPSQPQPPCPVLKVVQTPPSITEKPGESAGLPACQTFIFPNMFSQFDASSYLILVCLTSCRRHWQGRF